MEGFLWKKGGSGSGASPLKFGRRNWTRRFFLLQNLELRYYKDSSLHPSALKGIVPMQGAVVNRVTESKYKFQFQLSHVDGRVLDLRAESTLRARARATYSRRADLAHARPRGKAGTGTCTWTR